MFSFSFSSEQNFQPFEAIVNYKNKNVLGNSFGAVLVRHLGCELFHSLRFHGCLGPFVPEKETDQRNNNDLW